MQLLFVWIWGGLYIFDGYTRLRFSKWNIGVNAKQGESERKLFENFVIYDVSKWFGLDSLFRFKLQ